MNDLISNTVSMTSLEMAELVGSRHDKVKQSIERLAERGVIQLPPVGISENINNLGLPQKTKLYVFSDEQGKRDSIIVVAQLSPEFTARLVDRWRELEQGKLSTPTSSRIEDFQILSVIASSLNLSPSSSLASHKRLAERIAPNVALALPDYAVDAPNGQVSSEATASLTELLKQHGVMGLKTQAINRLLESHGYINTLERRGSKGEVKRFKNITDKGLQFGKNIVSPNNPRETQPHWYISTFPQLLDELGLNQLSSEIFNSRVN